MHLFPLRIMPTHLSAGGRILCSLKSWCYLRCFNQGPICHCVLPLPPLSVSLPLPPPPFLSVCLCVQCVFLCMCVSVPACHIVHWLIPVQIFTPANLFNYTTNQGYLLQHDILRDTFLNQPFYLSGCACACVFQIEHTMYTSEASPVGVCPRFIPHRYVFVYQREE